MPWSLIIFVALLLDSFWYIHVSLLLENWIQKPLCLEFSTLTGVAASSYQDRVLLPGTRSLKYHIRQTWCKTNDIEDNKDEKCIREVHGFGSTSVNPSLSFRGKPVCLFKKPLAVRSSVSSGINLVNQVLEFWPHKFLPSVEELLILLLR